MGSEMRSPISSRASASYDEYQTMWAVDRRRAHTLLPMKLPDEKSRIEVSSTSVRLASMLASRGA